MAVNLYRTRALLQVSRAIPALIARTQTTQTPPSAGKVWTRLLSKIKYYRHWFTLRVFQRQAILTRLFHLLAVQLLVIKVLHHSGKSAKNFSFHLFILFVIWSDTAAQQSFMNTPAGKFGAVAVLAIAACTYFYLIWSFLFVIII